MSVTVYTTPTCGYCHQVKRYLGGKGVSYREVDVSRDQGAAQEMVERSGQMGVPVIDVDGEMVVGFNVQELERLLAARRERPSLGLKVADAAGIAANRGGGPTSGAYVGAGGPGSVGAGAGLRVGDVIVSLGGETVVESADVSRVMRGVAAGRRLELGYLRNGQIYQTEVSF
jgi:glutaredoxin-like YruB-family protein